MNIKVKNILINSVIAITTIIIVLILVEFAFRKWMFNYYKIVGENQIFLSYGVTESKIPGIPFEYAPSNNDENSDWHFNRFGFRGKEIAVPKPAGVYRIVLLGDSQVYGGLSVKGTISYLLEQLLNSDPELTKNGIKFEVVNAGYFTFNIKELSLILRYKVKKIEPDLIIYNFFENDFDESTYTVMKGKDGIPVLLKYMSIYGENDFLGGKINVFLNRNSLFYRYIGSVVENLRYKGRIRYSNLMNKYDKVYTRFPLVVYLDDMIRDSKNMGAGFITSILGDPASMSACVYNDYNGDIFEEYIKYARMRGVMIINLLDTLCGRPVQEIDRGDGCHFKDDAHMIFAKRIYKELKEYFKDPDSYIVENYKRKISLIRKQEY